MAAPGASAAILLSKQFKRMQKEDQIDGISVGLADDKSVFEWEVMLMLSDEIPFFGGRSYSASFTISWSANTIFRWLLSGDTQVSERISSSASENEV
jgi:hypothetical protein